MNNDDVVDILNDLIETCKDGEYGFDTCAKHTKTAELITLFETRAQQCRQAAQELQAEVLNLGGNPDDGGSATGALHRGWVAVRGSLTGQSDHAMLSECERGEDAAKARYSKALKEQLPTDVRAVIERQYQGVLRNHDQVKALRDRYAATA